MKRTASNPASPNASVHANTPSTKRPRRKWKPEVERDRSMRAYEQNPRALEGFRAALELAEIYDSFEAAEEALHQERLAADANRKHYGA